MKVENEATGKIAATKLFWNKTATKTSRESERIQKEEEE